MKHLFTCIALVLTISMICIPAFGEETDVVEDITTEVLTGPANLDPEKILGPGGVGIDTHKNILMSFGATVRIIPTAESNWDFGMSDNVPGYFYVEPVKQFAQSALNTANTGLAVYQANTAFTDAVTNGRGLRSTLDDLSSSLINANTVIGGDDLAAASAGATMLKANADTAFVVASGDAANTYMTGIGAGTATSDAYQAGIGAGSAAATQYADAVAAQDATVAGAALQAISADADFLAAMGAGDTAAAQARAQQVAAPFVVGAGVSAAEATTNGSGAAFQAIATDPAYQAALASGDDAAIQAAATAAAAPVIMAASIQAAEASKAGSGAALQQIFADPAYQAAVAAGDTAASEAAAQAVVVQAAAASGEAAANSVIADNSATLTAGADAVASGIAAKITKDPNASAADINSAVAYATALTAQVDSFKPYYLANSFLKSHGNESGSVNDGYIRNETKIYFNAMPKDKKWSFYAALEFDRPIDTQAVDNRGGKLGDSSNFGLERLNVSIETLPGLRLHAGWDVWGVDAIESASMVYGDDNAGFWVTGLYDPIKFSIAWHKLEENDFQINTSELTGDNDNDRDLFAGWMDYELSEESKVRMFFAYDRIRSIKATDLLGAMASEAGLGDYAGISGGKPDTDAYHIGAYYLGKVGILEIMTEGVYKFGEARETGLKGVNNGIHDIQYDDFDIASYALAADLGFELKDMVDWMSFKPHIGIMYTSGDDDSTDDTLSGYSGVQNIQRYSRIWGGENTILADTNFVLGTPLYSYVPELYGNGTPVFVGGLQNMAGNGNGRGDNPGLTMISVGLTLRPVKYLIYKTNANIFTWNQDFYVSNMVEPITLESMATGTRVKPTKVEAGYVGTEWDNELLLALNQHMFIKTQASFFFPGSGINDVTAALSGGTESDEIATRIAAELIWNF